jgi:hypothetical protein
MKVLGIGWLGSRTAAFQEMVNFAANVLGMTLTNLQSDLAVFKMPNGDEFQLFGPENNNLPFADQPVAGFLVEDVAIARTDMEAKGVLFLGEIEQWGDFAWTYFRAPDGRVYELTHRTERSGE